MQLFYLAGALAAPALVSGLRWGGARQTPDAVKVADWSPAPTSPPELGHSIFELVKRQQEIGNNTCGFISGRYTGSLTCNNPSYVCAVNTFNGVQGCCDPQSMSACSLPTTCIASASLAACTGACLTNDFVAKCTNSNYPFCYNWIYAYPGTTTLTEWGCNSQAFTITALNTYTDGPSITGGSSTSPSTQTSSSSSRSSSSTPLVGISSPVSTPSPTSTSASPTPTGDKKSVPVGAIAGGVVGGVAVIGAIAGGLIFLCLRKKKQNNVNPAVAGGVAGAGQPQMNEYNKPPPQGPYDPQYAQQGYPQQQFIPQQQQPYANQPGNTASYYQPGPDVKHNYVASQQPVGSPQLGGAPVMGQHPTPYSPPMSPAPQYDQPGYNGPMQLDSTPVQGHPSQPPAQAAGHQIYEAPTTRD